MIVRNIRREFARRGAAAAVVGAAVAAMALPGLHTAHADAPVVSTRADTTVGLATNVATGTGVSTQLGALTITASGAELGSSGDIRVVAPAGWSFDTSADVQYTVGADGSLRINDATSGTVQASANAITLDVTADSAAGDTLTLTGIRVVPDAATSASGNLGLSLDGDTNVSNGPDDSADVSTLTALDLMAGAGTFDRPIEVEGVTPAVWNGGTMAQLASATSAAGGVSATVFTDGKAVVLIPGAPAFVNAEFAAHYSGDIESGTIVLVVR